MALQARHFLGKGVPFDRKRSILCQLHTHTSVERYRLLNIVHSIAILLIRCDILTKIRLKIWSCLVMHGNSVKLVVLCSGCKSSFQVRVNNQMRHFDRDLSRDLVVCRHVVTCNLLQIIRKDVIQLKGCYSRCKSSFNKRKNDQMRHLTEIHLEI